MEHTLPFIYLMDSITKNIGEPFKSIFSRKIHGIFLGAYKKIPSVETRNKLKHLLATWEPVFGSEQTKLIKEEAHKLDNPINNPGSAMNQFSMPPQYITNPPIV